MSKYLTITFLLASVEARFGQEQVPVSAVSALSNFGNPGEAATLAGGVPGVLLAAANPCDKLTLADKIVTTLGTDPSVISAAAGVVAAEQNFNPFNVDTPSICGDATLPATQELRGIVPLVDPAVTGSDVENANSATSVKTPFGATGMSVAQVMAAQGFSNFTTVDASGNKAAAAAASSGTDAAASSDAAGAAGAANSSTNSTGAAGSADSSASNGCAKKASAKKGSKAAKGSKGAAASNSTANADANANSNSSATADAAANSTATGSGSGSGSGSANATTGGTTSIAGADFGKCTPTMDLQFGRAGRKATEGTFLPTDPLVAQGQQDALNPNIITNRICDQLTNVCEANQAAKDACASAKALVSGLGTKDQTTADAFNQALGF